MKSVIHEKIGTTYPPVALLWADEAPEGAMQFKPGKWGCVNIRKQLGDHLMTFAAPYALFREMEENAPGSFLDAHTWQSLRGLRKG